MRDFFLYSEYMLLAYFYTYVYVFIQRKILKKIILTYFEAYGSVQHISSTVPVSRNSKLSSTFIGPPYRYKNKNLLICKWL